MAHNMIIEGLTGSGKTTVISRLLKITPFRESTEVLYEEETFGDLMDDLKERGLTNSQRLYRLHAVVNKIRNYRGDKSFLFERFHHSYYALMPNWNLYEALDKELYQLNFKVVLLLIPNDQIEKRSIFRSDLLDSWQKEFLNHFGSVSASVQALQRYQEERKKMLALSKLKTLKIDTGKMEWDKVVQKIMAFSGIGTRM